MPPSWLLALSWATIALGILSALWTARDVLRRRQPMAVMNAVWPLCALFGGPLLIAFYLRHGRVPEGGGHPHHAGDGAP